MKHDASPRGAAPEPQEMQVLRLRLAEATEALRAIREGDVDAVVVSGTRGEQVYTLTGAELGCRQLLEAMSEGAVTLSAAGVVLYCNGALAKLLGRPPEQVLGSVWRESVAADDRAGLEAMLAQARSEPSRLEVNLTTGTGQRVPAYLSGSRLHGAGADIVWCLVVTDLTARKRHAQLVSDSRLVNLILEQGTEAIVLCDDAGRIVRASQPARRFCEGDPSQKRFVEAFPLCPRGGAALARVPGLGGAAVKDLEVTLEREGHPLTLILNAGPLLEGHRSLGCVITLTDITERRRAEEALLESEELYRSTVEQAAVGIARVALDGSWLNVNKKLCEILGYSEAELLASTLQALTHPDDADADLKAVRALKSGEIAASSREKRYLRQDGSVVWCEHTACVVRGSGAEPKYFITILEDITSRKRADAAHARLVMAIEQAAEMVLITDAAGNIEYVNPAFEGVTGYTRAEVAGQNPRLLQSGEQDAGFYRNLWATLTGGRTWRGRLVNKKKDGSLFSEEASISPVRSPDGVTTSYVAVKRDVTEEISREAQLLQSQKMEGIGSLAGGIAHDFNNLLSVILSYTGIAIDELREEDPLREDLAEVKKAGERGVALTRQLLAFSRKQLLQPVDLDLNQVLLDLQKMLRRLIREDIELLFALAPDLGLVSADRGQLEQVIMNLAINAGDAMPKGGTLAFETAHVEFSDEAPKRPATVGPGPYVRLSVTDTGVGMGASTLARIFEPFFTTKGLGKGTGLGLSTVYGIVRQTGGQVLVTSELGLGTVFTLYFPRLQAPHRVASSGPRPTTPPEGGSETILVVEDEEALRKVVRRMLEDAGYAVLTGGNGEEALLASAQHGGQVHLLLTDVVMPRMGGKALAAEFAKTRPHAEVLYMSGYTDDSIGDHGVLHEGTNFIEKPFTAGELTRKVREVLDRGGAAHPG